MHSPNPLSLQTLLSVAVTALAMMTALLVGG